jgi:hypothetical protein
VLSDNQVAFVNVSMKTTRTFQLMMNLESCYYWKIQTIIVFMTIRKDQSFSSGYSPMFALEVPYVRQSTGPDSFLWVMASRLDLAT